MSWQWKVLLRKGALQDMIRLRPERAQWELKNETNKVYVRWLFVVLVFGYFAYVLKKGALPAAAVSAYLNWSYIGSLVLVYSVFNIFISLYLVKIGRDEGALHPGVKYLTMVLDLVVASLVILPTGGEKSMFFLLYIVIIISNTMRYGIRIGIVALVALNFLYVGVLMFLHYPKLVLPDLQTEILKIAGLWIVGIYIGYLSRRFEIMQGEVEKYREIVSDLMERREEP
jgi:hypothetical protein